MSLQSSFHSTNNKTSQTTYCDGKERKIVTCDIDGVLTDYPACWLAYLAEQCGIHYSTTLEAKKHEKRYSVFKDKYRESEYKASLPINERNRDALIQLSKEYEIIFTTSRPIYDE